MAELELKLVCVQIQSNKEVINVTVPEHEIRVLQAMHGPSNIRKVAELDPDVESFDVDDSAEREIARLDARYQHNGQQRNPVDVAFPSRELSLVAYGFKAGGEMDEVPMSQTTIVKPTKEEKAAVKAKKSAKK